MHVAPVEYPVGMEATDRDRQRVIDVITTATLDGIGEAEMLSLVRAGLAAARRIEAARAPIDWDNLPTIGSSR